MYSIGFPNIFNKSTVNLYENYEAIKSDLKLLLGSNRGGLYGDPYFGTNLKHILWDQAHPYVMKEIIRDDVFTAIYSYMPQITIDRDSIQIDIVDNIVIATINLKSNSDVKSDLLQINLLAVNEDEASSII